MYEYICMVFVKWIAEAAGESVDSADNNKVCRLCTIRLDGYYWFVSEAHSWEGVLPRHSIVPELGEDVLHEPVALREEVLESARHEHAHCLPRLPLQTGRVESSRVEDTSAKFRINRHSTVQYNAGRLAPGVHCLPAECSAGWTNKRCAPHATIAAARRTSHSAHASSPPRRNPPSALSKKYITWPHL